MTKPTVRFTGEPLFESAWPNCEIAYVHTLDHPRLGEQDIRTSAVMKKNEDGSFETLNTIYVPVEDGE